MSEERTGDEWGPLNTFEQVLAPAVIEALTRGAQQYGAMWKEYMRGDAFEIVQHTIQVHAETKLRVALQSLDYNNPEGFVKNLGSAVGYIAVAIHKLRHLGLLD